MKRESNTLRIKIYIGKIFGFISLMRNIFLIFLFFINLTAVMAQDGYTNPSYIRTFPHYLQASVSTKFTSDQTAIFVDTIQYQYLSRNLSPGVRLQYDKWGIGFQLPVNFLRKSPQHSSTLGMQVQVFPTSFMINAGVTRVKGFYDMNLLDKELEQMSHPLVWHIYFNPVYVFNGKEFSMNSLFQLDHHQLQSRGTPLAGISVDHFRLKDVEPTDINSSVAGIDKYVFQQNGIEFGYAYNYVLSENYFIAAYAKGNLSQTKFKYKREGIDQSFSKWKFAPLNEVFVALGYQSDQYFAALQLTNRNQGLSSGDIEVQKKTFVFQLMAGVRLYRPGLERRMLDKIKKWRD